MICVCKAAAHRMVTMSDGLCAALVIDPVEKALYHFFPGIVFVPGSTGCNLNCFSARTDSGQGEALNNREKISLRPSSASRRKAAQEQLGIAYTYNEPTVWFEFVRDTSGDNRRKGL